MEHAIIEKQLGLDAFVSTVGAVSSILEHAISINASDIHIDPRADELKIRLRIDGIMHDSFTLPKNNQPEIIARIKVLARLRSDEHALPQDGRFTFASRRGPTDIRVSIVPTYFGENAVLRVLSRDIERFTLETLGFARPDEEKIRSALGKSSGLILCTGPTGSGKTTTLYSLLKLIDTRERSVVTIEDPVEYAIKNVEQIQVNARAGLSFAQGLRSILRQDPDIILVGEIRDAETAAIAVNMALTGHLVLTTLHTNDAPSALIRLLDLKVERFLVASTVTLSIGQRLVRKVCAECRIPDPEAANRLRGRSGNTAQVSRGAGCARCSDTGYFGRTVLGETAPMTDELRRLVESAAAAAALKKSATESGMRSLFEDGVEKTLSGITTYQEIMRVTHE